MIREKINLNEKTSREIFCRMRNENMSQDKGKVPLRINSKTIIMVIPGDKSEYYKADIINKYKL